MAHVERSAVRIQQGNLTIYLTYLTPRDLFNNDFYTVDKLEPADRVGFQRILDEKRAARLERHLKEAVDDGYAHLPTTVFLATDKDIEFDEKNGRLSFDTSEVCPFSVVDGQHRIEGLRLASADNENLMDFQVAGYYCSWPGLCSPNVPFLYCQYNAGTRQSVPESTNHSAVHRDEGCRSIALPTPLAR